MAAVRKSVLRVLWFILQLTWCLPQNLAGLLLCLMQGRTERIRFHGTIVTAWKRQACTSVGCFLFMDERAMQDRPLLVHEFGHTVQSAILGWLYFPVIFLPSVLWFSLPALKRRRREKRISYYSFYTEKWANHLGEKYTGEPSIGQAFID